MGNFPDMLSQQISVGRFLAGRLGVHDAAACSAGHGWPRTRDSGGHGEERPRAGAATLERRHELEAYEHQEQ